MSEWMKKGSWERRWNATPTRQVNDGVYGNRRVMSTGKIKKSNSPKPRDLGCCELIAGL